MISKSVSVRTWMFVVYSQVNFTNFNFKLKMTIEALLKFESKY